MSAERDYLTAIGARIATTRKSAGITQARLAEAVGLSRASIANIEVGNQDTTLTNMAAIARALGVTCDHLVRDPDDKSERKVTTWKTRLVEETATLREELAKTRTELDNANAALRRLGDQANHLVQRLDAAGTASLGFFE